MTRLRLWRNQREEHLGANCISQLVTFKSERREALPVELRQGETIDFRDCRAGVSQSFSETEHISGVMNSLLFKKTILAALLSFPLVTSFGCSSFQRDWQAAAKSRSAGIEGRWRGRWESDSNRHGGALRCLVESRPDGKYDARFHAIYKKFLSFHYTALLDVRGEGDEFRFAGQADLGKLAGGTYSYEGEVSGTNFFARYSSKYDRGTFKMTRP